MRKAERGATYPEAEGAYDARVAELAGASHAAQENVDALNTQLQALQQQREGVKAQVAALQQKADRIEEIVTQAEPRTRWAVAVGPQGGGGGGGGETIQCALFRRLVAAGQAGQAC